MAYELYWRTGLGESLQLRVFSSSTVALIKPIGLGREALIHGTCNWNSGTRRRALLYKYSPVRTSQFTFRHNR